ncbi:MAG: HlyD family efflux transporter periplasmic adaptor subunit [Bacteroidota bacterium]
MEKAALPSAFLKASITEKLKTYTKKLDEKIEKLKLPKPLKNRYVIIGIAVLLLILIISFAATSKSDVEIPTFTLKQEKFLVSITESGEIRAKNSISVSAPRIRGNLKIVFLIPEGTYVNPNDVVCRFDPSEAVATLRDAEAKLEIALSDKEKLIANHKASMAQMESQLKSAELSFELSKLKLEQVKFEAQSIQQQTKLEHEKNKLSFEQTKQEYESKKVINKSEMDKMEVEIKQRKSDLEKAQRDLEQLTLTAPSEGLVVYGVNWSNNGRKFAVGDTPWGGAQIITLPDLSAMESVTNINEVDVSRIKKNQNTIVKLDAFQDSSFAGEVIDVASIGKQKEQNSNIKVFEVIITIKSQSDILRPGMTTSNKIIINEIPNVLFIPQEAVFEKEGKKIVYKKNGSGFDPVQVELGERGEDYIIVKKGLSNEDIVALVDPTLESEETGSEGENVTLPNSGS